MRLPTKRRVEREIDAYAQKHTKFLRFAVFFLTVFIYDFVSAYKFAFAIGILLTLVLFTTAIVRYMMHKKNHPYLVVVISAMIPLNINRCLHYSFVDRPKGLHFGMISTVFGIVAVILALVLILKNVIVFKDAKWFMRLLYLIVTFAAVFTVVWSTVCNANYILDSSEPTAFTAEIIDKDYSRIRISRHRRRLRYKLVTVINGERVQFNVSSNVYQESDVGESFTVYRYEGAFGDAYYMSSNDPDN